MVFTSRLSFSLGVPWAPLYWFCILVPCRALECLVVPRGSENVLAGAARAVKTLFDSQAAALNLHAFYQACQDHEAQRISQLHS